MVEASCFKSALGLRAPWGYVHLEWDICPISYNM